MKHSSVVYGFSVALVLGLCLSIRSFKLHVENNRILKGDSTFQNETQERRQLLFPRNLALPLSFNGIFNSFIRLLPIGVRGPAATDETYKDDTFKYQRFFKHFQYSQLAALDVSNIFQGKTQPLIYYKLLEDPPSIFINWEIRSDKKDAFVSSLNFPDWLEMVPVKIFDDEEEEKFYLSLNVYEVSGLHGFLTGLRAEWSIYVAKPGDRPSYMIIKSRHTTSISQNSVEGFTTGVGMSHSNSTNGIETSIEKAFGDNTTIFHSVISKNGILYAERRKVSPRWVAANDLTYWLNGIADRVYYDGLTTDTPALSVDTSEITIITDNTGFDVYLSTIPVSVIVFDSQLDFVVSPWYNLDD